MASMVLVISTVKTPASQFTCLLVRQDNTGMIVHLVFCLSYCFRLLNTLAVVMLFMTRDGSQNTIILQTLCMRTMMFQCMIRLTTVL